MPRQDDELVQGEGDHRVLHFGAVRVHNNHLQSGRTSSRGCPVCSEGLEGFMPSVPSVEVNPEVDASNGGDEERDPTPSSGSWDDPR